MDWSISPIERQRHGDQFSSIGPVDGYVNGIQAKGFFMQSGLPPKTLAEIWALADMDSDGRMSFQEFSIACKLITNTLKGFEVPRGLPPSLLHPLPMSLPVGGVMPAPAIQQPLAMPRMMPPSHTMLPPNSMMAALPPSAMPPNSMMAALPPSAMPPNSMMPQLHPSMMIPVSMAPVPNMMNMQPIPTSIPVSIPNGPIVPTPTSMSLNMQQQMVPMHDGSGSSTPQQQQIIIEWGIPPPTRVKYATVFNQSDRARTGFLAGVPARNILLRSGLPQNTLAQIWALSDADNDGRLSLEEFILSGYLCDLAQKGEPMPNVLPSNLLPPSQRKNKEVIISGTASNGGGVGTPSSVKSAAEELSSPTSFEDKRRENFNKGHAELERRRQSLIDQQRKEEDERKKKEKEEAEEREKQKRELERQRLAEWEAQRKAELIQHRQREQEKVLFLKAKQDNLKQELEANREKVKNLTTNISDTRSGVTDVKTFIDGMRSSRDSKMGDMNALKVQLKDQNARLISVTQEKAKLEARSKITDAKIAEGRDEELSHFEVKKQEKEKEVNVLREKLAILKNKEEEKKDKYNSVKKILLELEEKLKLIIEVCRKLFSQFDEQRREVRAEKAKRIRELTDPDAAWGVGFEVPTTETVVINTNIVHHLQSPVKNQEYIKYRALYEYEARNDDELGFKVGEFILVHPGQDHEPGWLGGELNGRVGWFPEAYAERVDGALQPIAEEETAGSNSTLSTSTVRVLYDWTAIKRSELSIEKDQTINVTSISNDNWWQGESSEGKKGYFPANFVTTEHLEKRGTTPTEVPEVIGSSPSIDEPQTDAPTSEIRCVALYPYNSEELGDLTFDQGDIIYLVSQAEDWWTGRIGDRTGVFPFNYVEIIQDSTLKNDTSTIVNNTNDVQELPVKETESQEVNVDELPESIAKKTEEISEENKKENVTLDDTTGGVTNEIKAEVVPPSNAGTSSASAVVVEGTGTTKRKNKKKKDESGKSPEIATVVAPYEATSKEQISLQKGQMILIKKKNSTGWWQGEVQGGKGKKRQLGWFPANYVKIVGGLSSSSSDKQFSAANTPASQDDSTPKVESSVTTEKQTFRALFPYIANHEDELAFEADDIITLISKEEEAWWKGECKGQIGVFPSNYVEIVE
uniref:Uncharacterized protein n=1 Tax=Lepeophtheirus salmonis TaxID=72036 RepID=A0A0K2SY41_LEPSM